MTTMTINIVNVYSSGSDDLKHFNVMVQDHNQSLKFDIPNLRAKRAKLGRYLDKFYADAKEAGYNKPDTAKLVSKYFNGFMTDSGKINSVLISNYRKFGTTEQKVSEYAVKIGSQSANPIRLNGLYSTHCKAELEKVKQQERLDDSETVKTVEDDKQETVEDDKKTIRRVQGAKHLQREVDPIRQGESKPMTPAESIQVLQRSVNAVISFDNDDSYTKEQVQEAIRILDNASAHLKLESDSVTLKTVDNAESNVVSNLFDSINANMINAVG